MKLLVSISLVLAALSAPTFAQAAQFEAQPQIFNGTGYGASYAGPGGAVQPSNQWLGAVVNGGNGAFDMFGFYNSGVSGLTQTRKVDLLQGNTFRFFDTFTNNSGGTISSRLNFFGNLGSDGWELVSHNTGGLVVSCTDSGSGSCVDQPVLALVSGNNGLGVGGITPDRYNVGFNVNLAAGQSLSLLNFAFLASGTTGPTDADVTLATNTGLSLLSAPRLEGLTQGQIASIANYTIASPVPEPATWVMMIVGFGTLGVFLRRRNTAYRLA
jgi:hypothetical protein